MCGLVGVLYSSPHIPGGEVQDSLSANPWRGPNNTSIVLKEGLGLGHHRLSIVDLNPRSNQPLKRGVYTLVFNGEIYNYRTLRAELKSVWDFQTDSDSEVIIAAYHHWGEACVKRFNGDWAFAIYDERSKSLFLSRDRFGIKPLYYAVTEKGIVFGSEIRNILKIVPGKMSDQALLNLFINAKVAEPRRTPYDHILPVPPGHNLTVQAHNDLTLNLKAYYGADDIFGADVPRSFDKAVERFGELFEDAVNLRFIADVEIGVCLSGGLDSSLIAGVLAKHNKALGLNTFSGIAPGCDGDESEYSRLVAEHVGSLHHEILLQPHDVEHLIFDATEALDSPLAGINTLGRAKVLSEACKTVTVVLDGQGADEILCGYHRYHDIYRAIEGHEFPTRRTPSVKRAKFKKNRVLNSDRFDGLLAIRQTPPPPMRQLDAVTAAQYSALCGPGLLSLLHTEDRLTMWNSMEGRVPFMDHRLVEFCMSAPLSFRIDGQDDKRLAREYARRTDLIPNEVIDRKDKLGFTTPYAQSPAVVKWLSATARKLAETQPDLVSRDGIESLITLAGADTAAVSHLSHIVSFLKCVAAADAA